MKPETYKTLVAMDRQDPMTELELVEFKKDSTLCASFLAVASGWSL